MKMRKHFTEIDVAKNESRGNFGSVCVALQYIFLKSISENFSLILKKIKFGAGNSKSGHLAETF